MSNSRPNLNYGWYVLAASFAILFVNAGARLMIGVFEKPVIAEFGWSRGQFSAVIFVNTAVLAGSMLVTGHLYDRFGPKWVILASSLLFSAGLLLTARMDGLWQFFLFYGVIAGAGLGGIAAPIFGAIVSHWFVRARGTAISLAMSGASLGQFALVPLFTMYYLDEGWRSTMAWMGVISLVVNVALVFLVLRGDPDDLGKEPYGRAAGAGSGAPAEVAEVAAGEGVIVVHPHVPLQEARSVGLREAMRTRAFWLFTVAMFVCGAGDFLLTTHLVAMATDYGVPTSTAVAMLAWFGLLSLGGILLAGPASDLIGDKVPIAAAFAIRVVVFALVVRYQTTWAFWVLALGFGFTFLVTAPLATTLMGRLYGFASIGLLSGVVTTVHHLGGGVWAFLGGVVFDATGAYTSAMVMSAVASAVAVVCTLLIKEVRHVAPDDPGGAGAQGLKRTAPASEVVCRPIDRRPTGAGPQSAAPGGGGSTE